MRWIYRIFFWGILLFVYFCSYNKNFYIAYGTGMILYYANRITMREILGRKKYFLYFLTFCILWLVGYFTNSNLKENSTYSNFFSSINRYIISVFIPWFILTMSFIATVTKDWFDGFSIKDNFKFKIRKLQYEKTKAEMEILKTQLSPHLYKNLLTNIYELVLNNNEDAPDAIVTLKELMEYLLYETAGKEKIEIEKEINFIEKLIEIRKLGLNDKSKIKFSKTISLEAENKFIIPFALLPFIENLFTHCNFGAENAYAKIDINIDTKLKLKYSVENTINNNDDSNNKKGGLGLKNLKSRIDEYYKNKYELSIYRNKELFISKLKIILS